MLAIPCEKNSSRTEDTTSSRTPTHPVGFLGWHGQTSASGHSRWRSMFCVVLGHWSRFHGTLHGNSPVQDWFVYIARCSDGTLYIGITRDVAARIAAHNAGRGARYTRGRGPLQVLAKRKCA